MNLKKSFLLIAFMASLLVAFSFQNSSEHKVLFEKAKFTMETKGDLKGAIKLFEEIIQNYPDKREYAAKSQLYIGLCYEKLGIKEAQKAYQKVIDNYPEQQQEVAVAKEKLSLLQRAQAVVEKSDKEFKIRKVSSGPTEGEWFGTPSLDGRYYSYVDWNTGDLGIRELATNKTRRLTQEGTWKKPMQFALFSIISPDSKLVAYNWYNPDEAYDLRLIGIDGSNRRILYSDKDYEVYPGSWSYDSKHIAVMNYNKKTRIPQIAIVDVADGSFRVLSTEKKLVFPRLCYSPDNRYIVFDFPVKEDSENRDIILLATDGSSEISLVKHPANDRLLGWVPGRNEVLFLSNRSGTWDIWLIHVEDGKLQRLPKPIKRNIGDISPLGFTQDGSFTFSIFTRWFTIQVAPFDLSTGNVQEQLSQSILGSNSFPAWSPDGKHLAYVSEQKEPQQDLSYHRPLHIRHSESGEERELASEFEVRVPRWSPNGNSILVIGYDNRKRQETDYNGGIYNINIKDGQVSEIVEFPQIQDWEQDTWWMRSIAEWSIDGKTIFYVNRGTIFMRELQSGEEKQLYQDSNLARLLDLSPDGKFLVFGTGNRDEGIWRILILSVSGDDPREICKFQESEEIRGITWTPDGKYLLLAENKKKGSILWRISPERGEPQKLWQSDKQNMGLSIHPDGKKIAFSTYVIESEIWVMENFLPEIEDKT